jgi:hypothetical protein
MSTCNGNGASASGSVGIDPAKRVKYNLGLVLGVDEFEQEQFFFQEQDQQHHLGLHGYGTVCGLRLWNDGLEVSVSDGMAVNPQGKVIRVPREQCANLGDWLDAGDHRAQLERCYGSTPGPVSLYVHLCYRECEADTVPLPGAPCRTEEDALAASRIIETFDLQLSPHPPRADEEEAVRAFGALLRDIEVVEVSAPLAPMTDVIAEVEARVRALLGRLTPGGWPPHPCEELQSPLESPLTSPLESPLESPLSSPLDGSPLTVAREDAAEVLRAAFRVWTTEVRPALLGGQGCADCSPDESCVLLGELRFEIRADGTIDPATLEVAQDERPILLHSRLLQEWLPGGLISGVLPAPVVLAGDASGPVASTVVAGLQGTPITNVIPAAGEVLTAIDDAAAPDGVRWEPRPVAGGQPLPPLAGDVNGDIVDNTIGSLQDVPLDAASPSAGQVLTAVKTGGAIVWRPRAPATPTPIVLAGDVTGNPASTVLGSIQKIPVDAPAPALGEVLTAVDDGGGNAVWRPVPPTVPVIPPVVLAGDVTGDAGANTIGSLQGVAVNAPVAAVAIGTVLTAIDAGGGTPVWQPAALPTPAGGNFIVAAGRFRMDGTTVFQFGSLGVTQFTNNPTLYFVEFGEFGIDRSFVVKGTPITRVSDPAHTVEFVSIDEDDEVQQLMADQGMDPGGGLVIRAMDGNTEPVQLGFMLEISAF